MALTMLKIANFTMAISLNCIMCSVNNGLHVHAATIFCMIFFMNVHMLCCSVDGTSDRSTGATDGGHSWFKQHFQENAFFQERFRRQQRYESEFSGFDFTGFSRRGGYGNKVQSRGLLIVILL